MSESTILVIALVSIVLGIANQGVATGTILGKYTWPAAFSPWVTPLAAFGAAFIASLQGDSSYKTAAVAGAVGIAGLFGAQLGLQAHAPSLAAPAVVKPVPAPPPPPAPAAN